jgi:hypothetical protein
MKASHGSVCQGRSLDEPFKFIPLATASISPPALGFRALLGIDRLQVWDVNPAAIAKFRVNMAGLGFQVADARSAPEAVLGADIITTVTADKTKATILPDNVVGAGIHINAVGGDCPGKTELAPAILSRSTVFVEYAEQTRIEGDIQQMPADFPVTELWRVFTGEAPGRSTPDEITLFDSVGFGIEDFSALSYVHALVEGREDLRRLDLIVELDNPRDLYTLLHDAAVSLSQPAAKANGATHRARLFFKQDRIRHRSRRSNQARCTARPSMPARAGVAAARRWIKDAARNLASFLIVVRIGGSNCCSPRTYTMGVAARARPSERARLGTRMLTLIVRCRSSTADAEVGIGVGRTGAQPTKWLVSRQFWRRRRDSNPRYQ